MVKISMAFAANNDINQNTYANLLQKVDINAVQAGVE